MMVDRNGAPILLVEDSPEDFETTRRAFRRAGLRNPMLHCPTGDDALDFLHHRGRYTQATAPRPGIILLDLNLPGTDGRELLAEIRSDEDLRSIPVVIVTTSRHHRDVEWCYQHGANGYHVKAIDYAKFRDEMRLLVAYWLRACVLPANAQSR